MYYIFADGQLLYSSVQQENGLIISPVGSTEVGKAGSVDFVMLPGHYLYSVLEKLKTRIKVFMDAEEIFSGRVLNWNTDFYGLRTVHCEGNLTYLLDSIQPPRDASMTPSEFFIACITEHNIQVDVEKRFTIGTISVTGLPTTAIRFSDGTYRDTRDTINSDLIAVYGGILRTRTVGVTIYIDYISSYGVQNNQVLQFGSNILDISENASASEVFTVLLPTSDAVASAVEGVPSWPMTIESVNSGSKLLEHAGGIAKFGRIVQTENFPGMTTPAALKAAAEAYFLRTYKEPPITFTVKALDLMLLGIAVDGFTVGKTYHVISLPHAIDGVLTCLAISYDFENIENTQLTIGDLITTPEGRNLAGTGGSSGATLSKAVGTAVGGKSGGTVGQTFKHITEGDDWLKLEAKRIDLIGETIGISATGQINLVVAKKDEIFALINLDTTGVKIFGKQVQITGENGVRLSAGLLLDKDLKEILDDAYSRLGITEGGLQFELVKDSNVIAAINASEEAVKLYGKQLEFTGVNGVHMSAGLLLDKDLKEILDDAYSKLGITAGQLLFEIVNNGNVVAAINVTAESAKIKSAKIYLDGADGIIINGGLAVQNDLGTIDARIDNLMSGNITASLIWATNLKAGSGLTIAGYGVTAKTKSVVTSIGVTNNYTAGELTSVDVQGNEENIYYWGTSGW